MSVDNYFKVRFPLERREAKIADVFLFFKRDAMNLALREAVMLGGVVSVYKPVVGLPPHIREIGVLPNDAPEMLS